ncbi:MAG: helix-turn-helix transcriptional regulator [Bdellovibrionota bacterium]
MSGGRNSQVARIFAIFDLLAGARHGLTVKEIHDRIVELRYEIGPRTIRRDLEAIEALCTSLVRQEDDSGPEKVIRFSLDPTTRITNYLVLSGTELLALYLARGMLDPLQNTPFYEDLQRAFAKIEGKIGPKGREYFDELSAEMHFDPWPRWGLGVNPDVLETVRAACSERHLLTVTYESANSGQKKPRKLGPHYLYFSKGSMYLVAEDLESHTVKTFAVPRMSDAKMEEAAYDGEPVDPEQFFTGSFGIFRGETPVAVKLEFAREIAPYVRERTWHRSQRVVAKGDGTIVFQLDVAVTPELVNWVMGFGAGVRVTEPAELREKVIAAAEGVLRNYSKKPNKAA